MLVAVSNDMSAKPALVVKIFDPKGELTLYRLSSSTLFTRSQL